MTLFNFCRVEDFRPKFKHLGDLTCIFPNAAHLAVTATATTKSMHVLGKVLQYNSPAIVQMNPDRPNIFNEVNTRLPKINHKLMEWQRECRLQIYSAYIWGWYTPPTTFLNHQFCIRFQKNENIHHNV